MLQWLDQSMCSSIIFMDQLEMLVSQIRMPKTLPIIVIQSILGKNYNSYEWLDNFNLYGRQPNLRLIFGLSNDRAWINTYLISSFCNHTKNYIGMQNINAGAKLPAEVNQENFDKHNKDIRIHPTLLYFISTQYYKLSCKHIGQNISYLAALLTAQVISVIFWQMW